MEGAPLARSHLHPDRSPNERVIGEVEFAAPWLIATICATVLNPFGPAIFPAVLDDTLLAWPMPVAGPPEWDPAWWRLAVLGDLPFSTYGAREVVTVIAALLALRRRQRRRGQPCSAR
ncbi:MAG: hypothetical protein JO358_15880 [Alphaproteobacteria bacterium]|nr:hypothetical protein [Alphaproteobacteria bacterium]